MARRKMYLQPVTWEEAAVKEISDEVMSIFQNNYPGPLKFINLYNNYDHLLNGKTPTRVKDFIEECGNIRVCKLS